MVPFPALRFKLLLKVALLYCRRLVFSYKYRVKCQAPPPPVAVTIASLFMTCVAVLMKR